MNKLGIISDDFTFSSVEQFAREISAGPVIVGYDARFLADKFAERVVKVLEEKGIGCFLTERDTPKPVITWSVGDKKTAGAVMITGADKPAEFLGIEFIPGAGSGSAAALKLERFEPRERYFQYLESFVDPAAMKKSKLKVLIDPMYGSGRGYLDKLLQRLGCRTEEIHNYRDVLFGGRAPDPAEVNLAEMKDRLIKDEFNLGIAFNGDASAFAWIDSGGKYHAPGPAKDAILESLLLVEKTARGII